MAKKKTRKEFIVYLICGVLTTLVNLAVYHIFFRLGAGVAVSGVISVICAKIFAYVSNKLWVFESHCETKKELGFEVGRFAIVRGLSGVVDVVLTWVLAKVIPEDFQLAFTLGGCSFAFVVLKPGIAAKYITQPIVIILNYVLGKKYVFKGGKEEAEESSAAAVVGEDSEAVSAAAGSEYADNEARPFHALLMLFQDYVQETFGSLYRFLFSSPEEEMEEKENMRMSDRVFAVLAYLRLLDFSDWLRARFSRNEGDAYYGGGEDPYTAALPEAGGRKSGFRQGGPVIRSGSVSWLNAGVKVAGFLIVLLAVFLLWRISKGAYQHFTMDQGHIFRQAHMFENLSDIFSNAAADRGGALFSALQIIYARVCAKLNYALLVTPSQYCQMSLAAAACCLMALAFVQTLLGISTASVVITASLVFFLAGKNILQLDGGLFILQLTLLLLILTSYGATLKSYQSGYKYFLFRCLLISLLAGLPGTMPAFAVACLILIVLTQTVGVIWNAKKQGFGAFLGLIVSRLLPLALPVASLWFFCGGIYPFNFEVNGNFWIASAPNPYFVSPWLNHTEGLCLTAVFLGALLMWLTDLKRLGLYGILSSVLFYFYLRLVKLDPGTAGYASTVFLAAVIGEAGILLGLLATLCSRLFCRFIKAPRLRSVAALVIVLPFVIFVLGFRRSSYNLENSDLTDVMEKVCQMLDDSEGGFKIGDILVLPKLGRGEESGVSSSSLYDVLRYEQRRKAARRWEFLENNDYRLGPDRFSGASGYAWWFVPIMGRPDFGAIGDICEVEALNETTALLKSVRKIHSAQQLAAMTLALADQLKATWSEDAALDISAQLLLMPPLAADDYLSVSVLKAYRKWILKGLEGLEMEELEKSRNSVGQLMYAAKSHDRRAAQVAFKLLCNETRDPWILINAYRQCKVDMTFPSLGELRQMFSLADEFFLAYQETFDSIYLNRPANASRVNEWNAFKREMNEKAEGGRVGKLTVREMNALITNSLPRQAVFSAGEAEQVLNGYFISGLDGWRSESEKEEKLPATFISSPDLRVLAQGEPGGKSGVSAKLLLPKGVFLGSAYARVPEGREAPTEVALKFRARGGEESLVKKWQGLCGQWTVNSFVITNAAECQVSFFLGSENVTSPGAVEFTEVSLRRIDQEQAEAWGRDPFNWKERREKEDPGLSLEEKELQLNREKAFKEARQR